MAKKHRMSPAKAVEKFFLAFVALIFLVACDPTPGYVISPEPMARLLADIYVGESVVEIERRSYSNDSAKLALKQSVYARHGVTKEEVDTSMVWYGHHMEVYVDVYDRVIELLEKDVEKASEITGAQDLNPMNMSLAFEGDSVDVWTGLKTRVFSRRMPSEFIPFSFSSDRNWERGDVYTLRSKWISSPGTTEMYIAVDYGDGTSEYNSVLARGTGWKDLSLALDSARVALNVYGAIRYVPDGNENAIVDSVMLYRTRIENGNMVKRRLQHTFMEQKW